MQTGTPRTFHQQTHTHPFVVCKRAGYYQLLQGLHTVNEQMEKMDKKNLGCLIPVPAPSYYIFILDIKHCFFFSDPIGTSIHMLFGLHSLGAYQASTCPKVPMLQGMKNSATICRFMSPGPLTMFLGYWSFMWMTSSWHTLPLNS